VLIGQKASIDTRNGVVPGHVVRIDAAAVGGTVLVDVTLDGPLPAGARPDLNVEGTIEIERLASVLYVGRPAVADESGTVSVPPPVHDPFPRAVATGLALAAVVGFGTTILRHRAEPGADRGRKQRRLTRVPTTKAGKA